ncbi:MAG: aminomethyl-transferring glycine dehydrogenase subunit GcvPA [Acidobacteriales bacterium]|nr:aminomethyl-transferring glycine dehydrogenase subunit GcvPA [Terriglobales bacterium]
MRYLPKSQADREAMLREIGKTHIDELFAPFPPEYRLRGDLNVPRQMSEEEIVTYFKQRSEEMVADHTLMLGAGVYHHYRPVVIDALISRGEFFTAYTPYQAEIAQGTLQAVFEFQTMVCQLTGMEVANASLYDISTGIAEGALMAMRLTGRNETVIARTVHPEHREVMRTYTQHQAMPIREVGYAEDGRIDLKALDAAISDKTASVIIQSPNFFGTLEDVAAVADVAHNKGALLVVGIAEALSLGIVKPPSEADIVVMEAQSFGVPIGFGGPHVGVLATKEKNVRQMPGRLIGQTVDKDGHRGFVLTLSTREQHIRREKATSNICTNQGLIALVATIYMCIYGRRGLRGLAMQNLAKAAYAKSAFGKNAKVLFNEAPRFNEFVVQTKEDPKVINRRLLDHKIIGGLPLKNWYPELGNAAVWCATEMVGKEQIDTAAKAVRG